MAVSDDLRVLGAPVEDPIQTALFVRGLVLTRRQKAALLLEYLRERGLPVTQQIREAADPFAEFL